MVPGVTRNFTSINFVYFRLHAIRVAGMVLFVSKILMMSEMMWAKVLMAFQIAKRLLNKPIFTS